MTADMSGGGADVMATEGAFAGGVELLERALGYTLGSLHLVRPEMLGNPTPCREWDLHALLLHMNDSLLAMYEAITARHIWLDPPGEDDVDDVRAGSGEPAADLVERLRTRACRMMGAWANARSDVGVRIVDSELSASGVAAVGAVEVAVHGWDVARACGSDRPLPQPLAVELLELSTLFVRAADRPGRFAAPLPVSPDAGPGDRLLAYLGRRS